MSRRRLPIDGGGRAVRCGYSVPEIMVAAGVFMLFFVVVFGLLRGGQKAGEQAFWIQKTTTGLRNTARHVAQALQSSSLPSAIIFPGSILEAEDSTNDFKVHFSARGVLCATESVAITGNSVPGTQFLRIAEAVPEKRGFGVDVPGELKHHVYSLTKSGQLLYHRYDQTYTLDSGKNVTPAVQLPPTAGSPSVAQAIVEDVEYIKIVSQTGAGDTSPLALDIVCKDPRGHTRRQERVVAVPNTAAVSHGSDAAW